MNCDLWQVKNHPLPRTVKVKNQLRALGFENMLKDKVAIGGVTLAISFVTPFFIYNIARERVVGAKHLQVQAGGQHPMLESYFK